MTLPGPPGLSLVPEMLESPFQLWNHRTNQFRSCHDCSDGGLGVALAETAFAGDLGMQIDLARAPREEVERDKYLDLRPEHG